MKLLSSGSYNIAWFKLADFVARGEKERALSVYKLLMHSIADEAFAYQLEGDILLSFDDSVAFDRYFMAAKIYQQDHNYHKAVAVYEHILLFTQDLHALQALLDLYDLLKDQIKFIHTYTRFANLAVAMKNFSLLINRLHLYLLTLSQVVQAELYGYTFFAFLQHDCMNPHIEVYLIQALDLYMKSESSDRLTKFMAKLKVKNELFYEKAHVHLSLAL